ncbi:hypothetical protein NDU88_005155 [Pleurodeles waltl]|uniref:Uncharacterized protein n=1 Tax=Pleurodeles waltl TaxID=8319 RepID=A0AAV7LK84_PLEWA|nr:hypothetical protein NDU88_005155 [Pleurodeles waltl]
MDLLCSLPEATRVSRRQIHKRKEVRSCCDRDRDSEAREATQLLWAWGGPRWVIRLREKGTAELGGPLPAPRACLLSEPLFRAGSHILSFE